MFKLNYQGNYTFTSEDIGDYNADPALVFTAYSLRSQEWIETSRKILDDIDGFTVDDACKMIKAGIISVGQGGETYPIATLDDATALQEATGETFVKHLALGLIVMLRNRDDERKKKSETSVKVLKTGKASKSI
jgi:hypothetical protein